MPKIFSLTAAVLLTITGSALAENYCNGEGSRMPTEKVMEKLEMKGYKMHELSMKHGCYEAQGLDQYGMHVKVYLEPANGKIVLIRTL